MKFNEVIRLMIQRSGGSLNKINIKYFMEMLNDTFIVNPPNYWLGIKIEKNPLDLMIVQEIMYEKRPDNIIECGTAFGGSAYFMASLMDLMNIDGRVITIDKFAPKVSTSPQRSFINMGGKIIDLDSDIHQVPIHPKIIFINSDCLAAEIPKLRGKTMVILDCHHTAEHVFKELNRFSKFVTLGQYLIVEDTILIDKKGPNSAVQKFLKNNYNFIADQGREKYGITSNPGGFLLKIS